jgi:predicted nuclease of predicted toxin-antitoxin system
MRFLLDECVAKASAIRLRMLGHDVVRVGTDIRIPEDEDILALASSEQRVLVTHDQDFGDLVFLKRQSAPHGIVLFRYEPPNPEEVARRLQTIIGSGLYEFRAHMTVVDESKVRQRKC